MSTTPFDLADVSLVADKSATVALPALTGEVLESVGERGRPEAEGTDAPETKRVRRPSLNALTGIRFLAAFWVLVLHFGAGFLERMHMPRHLTIFFNHGHFGVCLFFMLSGFILYYTYRGNLETGRDLSRYFVARFARVYPVYFLALVLAASVSGALPHGREWLVIPLLQSWLPAVNKTGLAMIGQAWTLSVEAFFYVSFPVLLLYFRRNWSRGALWSLVCVFGAIAVGLRSPDLLPGSFDSWVNIHMLLPVLCLPEFVLGMLLGALFLDKRRRSPTSSTSDWVTLAGAAPCCVAIAYNLSETVLAFAAVFCFGWAIYHLADGRGWLTRFLSSRAMLLLGGASFSIYILQAPVRGAMRLVFGRLHPGLDAVLTPVVLIPGCCLLFLLYEEPMRRLLHRLLVGRGTVSTVAAGPRAATVQTRYT